ncbi:MAG: Asp-tRNA(Asn)/Glu-tRNA(Gln) amidotransferase subunit GatC [Patulibacter minatonensis]
MIDAKQVLHVARLSRLELEPGEVEQMATELSSILGHIEQISQLDLDGVPATTHVVPIDGGLRADVPEDSLPIQTALSQAPKANADGFLVPSPQA